MAYNPEIHNRRTIRLKNYDYSGDGIYFVTVCTKDKENFLGKIVNGKFFEDTPGVIVKQTWLEIPELFSDFNIDDFVIMPNHIHGIVTKGNVGVGFPKPFFKFNRYKGGGTPPLQNGITLSRIMARFKYTSTKEINEIYEMPGRKIWQRNYYDHIIRSRKELNIFRKYIKDNPKKWEEDTYFV